MQDPPAFAPNEIQALDVVGKALAEANLVWMSVVLELPVRWGRNNEMDLFVRNLRHARGVAEDDTVSCDKALGGANLTDSGRASPRVSVGPAFMAGSLVY